MRSVLPAFFLSGFSALVYQVVWQRALFAIYGIHTEAVTVIVTVFMLGLGLGSLAGGAATRRSGWSPVLLFAIAELGVGLFGLGSLPLFAAVGGATQALSPAATAAVTFLVLLVPTLLMGATLPLLTTHVVRRRPNVGRSLSVLYAVNTLGSALASVAAAFALLGLLGQRGTVALAAASNFAAAGTAMQAWRRRGEGA
jgi:predicted membrane-bound spermidine synthase